MGVDGAGGGREQDGAFQGCYALGQITAPGCVQFGRRVFAECCSLSMVGPGKGANSALAPGAQIAPFAFEGLFWGAMLG